jgi:hypothetical protein
MATKNSEMLRDFIDYCVDHPEERFWQALRNWSGWHLVMVSNDSDATDNHAIEDTFYWEGKAGLDHE